MKKFTLTQTLLCAQTALLLLIVLIILIPRSSHVDKMFDKIYISSPPAVENWQIIDKYLSDGWSIVGVTPRMDTAGYIALLEKSQ